MNKREHVVNALLLGVGLGVLLAPEPRIETAPRSVAAVAVPVVLGALIPDLDTCFGTHRKTLHNVWVPALFVAFPLVFDNLHYVWIGVLTHFALDLLGNVRGMALVYPYPKEYDVPVGVTVDSHWAGVVTLLVTGVELAVIAPALIGDPAPAAVALDGVRAAVGV